MSVLRDCGNIVFFFVFIFEPMARIALLQCMMTYLLSSNEIYLHSLEQINKFEK